MCAYEWNTEINFSDCHNSVDSGSSLREGKTVKGWVEVNYTSNKAISGAVTGVWGENLASGSLARGKSTTRCDGCALVRCLAFIPCEILLQVLYVKGCKGEGDLYSILGGQVTRDWVENEFWVLGSRGWSN